MNTVWLCALLAEVGGGVCVSPGHVQPLYAGERGGRGHPAGRHQRGTGARTGLCLHGTGEALTHTHTRTYIHTYTITQIKLHRLTQIKLHRLTN